MVLTKTSSWQVSNRPIEQLKDSSRNGLQSCRTDIDSIQVPLFYKVRLYLSGQIGPFREFFFGLISVSNFTFLKMYHTVNIFISKLSLIINFSLILQLREFNREIFSLFTFDLDPLFSSSYKYQYLFIFFVV